MPNRPLPTAPEIRAAAERLGLRIALPPHCATNQAAPIEVDLIAAGLIPLRQRDSRDLRSVAGQAYGWFAFEAFEDGMRDCYGFHSCSVPQLPQYDAAFRHGRAVAQELGL